MNFLNIKIIINDKLLMMNDGSMIAYQLSFIFTLLLILKIEELSSDPGISL